MTLVAIILGLAFVVEHVRRKMAQTPDETRLELMLSHEEYAVLSNRYDLLSAQYEDLLEATRDPAELCAAGFVEDFEVEESEEVDELNALWDLPAAEVDR